MKKIYGNTISIVLVAFFLLTPSLVFASPLSSGTLNVTEIVSNQTSINQTSIDITNETREIMLQNSDGMLDSPVSILGNETDALEIAQGILNISGAEVPITYKEAGPFKVFEGDILLATGLDNETIPSAAFDRFTSGSATAWPDGKIPVVIQSAIQKGSQKWNDIGLALDYVERVTNKAIDFRPARTDSAGNILDPTYLRIMQPLPQVKDICGTYRGMLSPNHPDNAQIREYFGGQYRGQPMFVPDWCRSGSIAHEFGHTIGFFHEHTRCDAIRDGWIELNLNNIKPEVIDQYTGKCDPSQESASPTSLGTQYDYCSIMHYGAKGGNAINPNIPIIVPLRDVTGCDEIGQRQRYSPTDLSAIQIIYGSQ